MKSLRILKNNRLLAYLYDRTETLQHHPAYSYSYLSVEETCKIIDFFKTIIEEERRMSKDT